MNAYTRRAEQHRPPDADAIAREIRRLTATGLKPQDIATILGVNPETVLDALRAAHPTTNASGE